MRLREEWDASAGLISPWKAEEDNLFTGCDVLHPVWCVQY